MTFFLGPSSISSQPNPWHLEHPKTMFMVRFVHVSNVINLCFHDPFFQQRSSSNMQLSGRTSKVDFQKAMSKTSGFSCFFFPGKSPPIRRKIFPGRLLEGCTGTSGLEKSQNFQATNPWRIHPKIVLENHPDDIERERLARLYHI